MTTTKFIRDVEIRIDGQRFAHLGTTTLPDRKGTYAVLTARCADCGEPFVQHLIGRSFVTGGMVRRCAAHTAAGRLTSKVHHSAKAQPPSLELATRATEARARRLADSAGDWL